MTKVVLIPNPNLAIDVGSALPESHIPLGLVSLATILRRDGFDVEILDINRIASEYSYAGVAEAIIARDPSIVGFSTMCGGYPATVRLARRCKALKPEVRIIFGGPQATATDERSIEAFPFIDVIARGECELSITPLVRALAHDEPLTGIPGVTFRQGGALVRTPCLPPVADLDSLPQANYELYPHLGSVEDLPVEVGRGCPFACTFCSTKSFWRRNHRLRSANSLLATIRELHSRHHKRLFQLQHDHFTVSRHKVLELCDALVRDKLSIRWRCSARVDGLDQELLSRMAVAGCSGIFLGIETGSQRMQGLIRKRLDLGRVVETCREIAAAGMSFVASFILGFPEETMDDLIQTVLLMTELRFAGNSDEMIQLHLLSPVPGSELHESHGTRLLWDDYLSDISLAVMTTEDEELVRRYPDIFSAFYHYDNRSMDRSLLVRAHYLFVNLRMLPYTLYVLWRHGAFDYPRFLIDRLPLLDLPEPSWARFDQAQSAVRVPHFLETVLLEAGFGDHYVTDVLKYEASVRRLAARTEGSGGDVVVEGFRHNVEALIDEIAREKPVVLPRDLPEDRHWLLFAGEGAEVHTTRLHAEMGTLLASQDGRGRV